MVEKMKLIKEELKEIKEKFEGIEVGISGEMKKLEREVKENKTILYIILAFVLALFAFLIGILIKYFTT